LGFTLVYSTQDEDGFLCHPDHSKDKKIFGTTSPPSTSASSFSASDGSPLSIDGLVEAEVCGENKDDVVIISAMGHPVVVTTDVEERVTIATAPQSRVVAPVDKTPPTESVPSTTPFRSC
jgi:hypothetical protein